MELTRPASVLGMRLPTQTMLAGLAGAMFLFMLSVAIAKLGAIPALAGVSVLAIVFALSLLPDAAGFIAVVILYSNIVVIFAGTPLYQIVGASSAILLSLPVTTQLLIYRRSPRFDRVFGLMVLFLVVLLLSAFAAVDMPLAIREIVQFASEGLLIYLLLINVVRSTGDLHRLMLAAVLSCAALSMMTIYQAATHQYRFQFGGLAQRVEAIQEVERRAKANERADDEPAPIEAEEDGIALVDRASGPIGDPNRFAQILPVVFPWSLYFSRHGRSPVARLGSATAATLILTAVALTYSRGAFLTIAVLVMFLLLWRYIKPGRLALAGLVLVAIVAVTAPGVAVAFALSLVSYLGTGTFLHLSFERYLWFLVGLTSAALYILQQEQRRRSAEEALAEQTSSEEAQAEEVL